MALQPFAMCLTLVFSIIFSLHASPRIKDLKEIAQSCTFSVRYALPPYDPTDICASLPSEPQEACLSIDLKNLSFSRETYIEWEAINLEKDIGAITKTPEDTIESVFVDLCALGDAKYALNNTLNKTCTLSIRAHIDDAAAPFQKHSASHLFALELQKSVRTLCAHPNEPPPGSNDTLKIEPIARHTESNPKKNSPAGKTNFYGDQPLFENPSSSITLTLELEDFGIIPYPVPTSWFTKMPMVTKIILKNTRVPFFAAGPLTDCRVMCEFAGTRQNGWHDALLKRTRDQEVRKKAGTPHRSTNDRATQYPIAFFENFHNPWSFGSCKNYNIEIKHLPNPSLPLFSMVYHRGQHFPEVMIDGINNLQTPPSEKYPDFMGLLKCLQLMPKSTHLMDANWKCVRTRFKQEIMNLDDDIPARDLISKEVLETICEPGSLTLYFENDKGDTVDRYAITEHVLVEEGEVWSNLEPKKTEYERVYAWYVSWTATSSLKAKVKEKGAYDPSAQDVYTLTFGPVYTAVIQEGHNTHYSQKMPGPHTFRLLLSSIAQQMFKVDMTTFANSIESKVISLLNPNLIRPQSSSPTPGSDNAQTASDNAWSLYSHK